MTRTTGIVVVGASAAGLAAVEELRRRGHEGQMTLVGDEPHLPYDRPPLSKQLLSGAWEPEKTTLRSAETYEDLDVRCLFGTPADRLDVAGHRLGLADGMELGYESLVIATGARARTLPGLRPARGIHALRTVDDALALRAELASRPHLVIVGGGFVGAEAAAVARSMGCEVTLVSSGAAPLAGTLGDDVGAMLADVHHEHGVHLITGTRVAEVLVAEDRATGVRLDDGSIVEAGVVLLGIGAVPNTAWLSGSGLSLADGVDCDATLRAGEDVWAAGDIASWPDPVSGERVRIEHRTNATEQGMAVARNILAGVDGAAPFAPIPYVWSDQYGLKIQIHGRTRGADEIHIVDGALEDRKFTAVYARRGHISGAVGVNMFRSLRGLRPLVAERAPLDGALAGLAVSA